MLTRDPAFEITAAGGTNALNLQCDNCQTFDLDTLNQPHQIEHDGSMTRLDYEMPWNLHADNHDFNQTVWDESQDLMGCNTHINPQLANHVRTTRFTEAQADDVTGWFQRNDGGSLAEHGFILSSMHDYSTGPLSSPSARLDWINFWFQNERLPSPLGWVKPQTVPVDTYNSIVGVIGGSPATSVVPKAQCASSTKPSSTPAPTSKPSPTATPKGGSNSTAPAVSSNTTVPAVSSNKTSPATSTDKTAPTTLTDKTSLATSTDKPAATSAPFPIGNSTTPLGSGTGTAVSSGTITKTPSPTTLPGDSSAAGGSTGTITSSPTTPSSVPASVTSSAQSKATELAGPAPTQPNAYVQVLSNAQWISYSQVVNKYIVVIQNLCSGLLGSHEVGTMPMPGAASAGNGAPWMSSMAAPPASTATITDVTTVTVTPAGFAPTGAPGSGAPGSAPAGAPGSCSCA